MIIKNKFSMGKNPIRVKNIEIAVYEHRENLYVPLQLAHTLMNSGVAELNMFRCYLGISFCSSGNIKYTNELLEKIADLTNMDKKSVRNHIKNLISKKYLGFNPNTNTIFVTGLDKLRKMFNISSRKAFLLKVNDIFDKNRFKSLIFTSFSENTLYYQKRVKSDMFLRKQILSSALDSKKDVESYLKHLNLEKPSLRKRYIKSILYNTNIFTEGRELLQRVPNNPKNKYVENVDSYLGISCSIYADNFKRSKSWASKMKSKASEYKFSTYQHMFKPVFQVWEQNIEFTRQAILEFDDNKYNRYSLHRINNRLMVCEQLYDSISINKEIIKLVNRCSFSKI
jgi:DNA-binding MarR family transcriptional regulator